MKIGRTALITTAAVAILTVAGPAAGDILNANFSGYADHSGGVPGVYTVRVSSFRRSITTPTPFTLTVVGG